MTIPIWSEDFDFDIRREDPGLLEVERPDSASDPNRPDVVHKEVHWILVRANQLFF